MECQYIFPGKLQKMLLIQLYFNRYARVILEERTAVSGYW